MGLARSDWLHSGWSQGGRFLKEIQEKLVGPLVCLLHDDVKRRPEGALSEGIISEAEKAILDKDGAPPTALAAPT